MTARARFSQADVRRALRAALAHMGASISSTPATTEGCMADFPITDGPAPWSVTTDDAELRRRKATKPPCGGKAMKGDDRG